jgi:acetyl esterase/lipase
MTDTDLRPPLDPEIDAVFRALPPDSRWRRTVGAKFGEIGLRRGLVRAESVTDDELRYGGRIEFDEIVIPGPAGAPGIATLVLRPAGETGPLPCIYFLHGSGMVMPGNRTMMGTEQLDWVADLGAVLVSIDYRVAPEDPHPAPVEDCYAGLQWVASRAGDLGVDSGRVILAGVSGGGGLAAATALLNRDRGGAPVAHQVLVCPMLDDREITTSSKFEGIVWDSASNRAGWTALLGDKRRGPDVSQYAAPARAADLSNLPPTYLDTGSSEVFRDEIMDYASRLVQAGTMVELHVWAGAMHGSEKLAPYAEVSMAGIAARKSYLRRAVRAS